MNFCGIQPFGSFDDTGVVLNDKTELNGKIECSKNGQVLTAMYVQRMVKTTVL